MVSNLDIVRELVRYLSGEIDLNTFRDWSVGVRLDNPEELGQDARVLLAGIEGRYAEFSDGLVPEDFLKQRLWALAQGVFVSFSSTAFASIQEAPSGTSSSLPSISTSTDSCRSELTELELVPM